MLGLLQKVSGATKHYWFWESAAGAPFGPFMNYDQFASYMAMVLPMGLGYLWGQPPADKGDRMAGWGWRERLLAVVGAQARVVVPVSLGTGQHGCGAHFYRLTAIGGLPQLTLFYYAAGGLVTTRGRHLALVGLVLAFCVLAYALWLGIDHVWQRFLEIDDGVSGRTTIWSGTLELIDKFPCWGPGSAPICMVCAGIMSPWAKRDMPTTNTSSCWPKPDLEGSSSWLEALGGFAGGRSSIGSPA